MVAPKSYCNFYFFGKEQHFSKAVFIKTSVWQLSITHTAKATQDAVTSTIDPNSGINCEIVICKYVWTTLRCLKCLKSTVKCDWLLQEPVKALTCTVQQAAITPEMGLAERGSNSRSGRRMKSGFNRYLHTHVSEVKYTGYISRAWCKTIVTTSFYIRSCNSFAPSPRYILWSFIRTNLQNNEIISDLLLASRILTFTLCI